MIKKTIWIWQQHEKDQSFPPINPTFNQSRMHECSPSAEEAGAKPRPSTQSKCSSERMSSWPVPRLLLWTLLGGWKTWIILKLFWSSDELFCCFVLEWWLMACFPQTRIIRCSWQTCLSQQHTKACHGQWISVPKSVELTENTLPRRCHGHHWIPNLQILHRQHPKQPCQHKWMRCTVCGSEVKKAPTRYDKVWCPTKIVPGFHHCSSFVVWVDPVLHALPSAVAPHNGTGWKARPWRSHGYCFPSQVHQNEKESAGCFNLHCSWKFLRTRDMNGKMEENSNPQVLPSISFCGCVTRTCCGCVTWRWRKWSSLAARPCSEALTDEGNGVTSRVGEAADCAWHGPCHMAWQRYDMGRCTKPFPVHISWQNASKICWLFQQI